MDTFEKKIDIEFLECSHELDTFFDKEEISFFESGDVSNSVETTLENIIERVKKFFTDTIEKINNFFNGKKVSDKVSKVEKAVKENPELKSKKVSYNSRNKLIKLNEITLEDICNAKDIQEVEAKMQKYRKQRNKAIAAMSLITISLSTLGVFIIGKQKELNKNLKHEKDVAEKKLRASTKRIGVLKGKICEQEKENSKLKADVYYLKKEASANTFRKKIKAKAGRGMYKVNNSVNEVQTQIRTEKVKANAVMEIASNSCKDIASEGKSILSTVINPTTSKLKKVTTAVSSVGNSVGSVKNAVTTIKGGNIETLKEKRARKNSEGSKLVNEYNTGKKKLANYKKGSEEYKRGLSLLNDRRKKIISLKNEITAIDNAIADAERKS